MNTSQLTHIDPTDRRVELHVRTDVPSERYASVYDRLHELETVGAIAESTVTVWPDRVHLDADRHGVDFVETFERFQSWASEAGVDINPPFVVSEGTRTVVGERYAVLRAPTVCLAVAEGDDLVGVYPCASDEETHTVEDALDALAAPPQTDTVSVTAY